MGEMMEKIKKSNVVVIKFGKSIDKERLVKIFGRVNNRFKIWGNPMRLGPNKSSYIWRGQAFLEINLA
jgi:hypothetical protein